MGKILLVAVGAGMGALVGLLLAFLGAGNTGILIGAAMGAILFPLIVARLRV